MQTTNSDITDISALLDAKYGKVGTPEREQFRKEAYAWYMEQIQHSDENQIEIGLEEYCQGKYTVINKGRHTK